MSDFINAESSRKMWLKEPALSWGKSACGRHCSLKFERPEMTDIEPPLSSVLSITSEPSDSLRTMS